MGAIEEIYQISIDIGKFIIKTVITIKDLG